ncbi:hypothetical protein ABT352_33500 [Streptosporangium sp. NPDC000563]|uniref:hypothetical protein n=1 Tax=Streptosporangium sp. NPDC000563 TaxID=3154366 RepID=UPI00332F1DCB
MSDRHALHVYVLHSHLSPYLRHLPFAAREDLFSTVAEGIMTASAEQPTTVLHPYLNGPDGCRQTIGARACGRPADDDAHAWPFGDPTPIPPPPPLPERTWHIRQWTIRNPAAPSHAFDDINPVTTSSWVREDDGTTGDDIVILWPSRFSAFYGGWDADQVAAAWQADRDRLANAGGFVYLPLGPKGTPDDELAEPPHECAPTCYCWD